MWNTWWPYHRTQLDDIAAVQELVRQSSTPFSAELGVARARGELAATRQLRDQLLNALDAAQPSVLELLEGYESLPRKLKDLRLAAGPIGRSASFDRLLLLLFAHPAWEVRADASAVAATVASSRPETVRLIADWIDHSDYRVRYAAIEAAYRMRYRDNGALFEQAVRRRAGDEQSWVRGIAADCLAEWIGEGEQEHAERLERLRPQVIRFLHDSDMWPLESMVAMIRQLREEGVPVLDILGAPIGGLLGRIPEWYTLERAELQPKLDALLRPDAGAVKGFGSQKADA
jgi:hypothetical protein